MTRTVSIGNFKYSIQQAFRECFYAIPDYQRAYVWEEEQVHQLLEDIDEQFGADTAREYFIGTVLVSPKDDQDGHYDVIDGQQRLTTFFLLLYALRHIFNGAPQQKDLDGLISTSYTNSNGDTQISLKLDPRYENASEFMTKLVEIDGDPALVRAGINGSGIPVFGSMERLISAYATIYHYLKDNYDDMAELKKYWGYLSNKVVFIQISADVSSALKIFETINERGVGLNPMDLLKNLLFTKVEPKEFQKLKAAWENITTPLDKAKKKPLRFLRYFLMANYPVKNEKGESVVYEDRIYDWLTNKENAALCGYSTDPFGFVRKIARNVEYYIGFTKGLGNNGNQSFAMESLKRLAGEAFSLHYVLLLSAAPLPSYLFDHFVSQLESLLFYYIFTKTPTKDLEKKFGAWAGELRGIAALADNDVQAERIDAFVKDHFQADMSAKVDELSDSLRRLALGSMQKYRIKYFLDKLTQHVDLAFRNEKSPASLAPYENLEIEHILPDNPKNDLRAAWKAENPDVDYDVYKNRLGNLTLLEKPHNIVASNGFYEKKKALYKESQVYLTKSLVELSTVGQNTGVTRINSKLAAFPTWDAASIDRRQTLLIDLARDIWKTTAIAV